MIDEEKSLDDYLSTYQTEFTPDKIKERDNLSSRVSVAFDKAINSFLAEKNGKDHKGNPLSFGLGSKEHDYADAQYDAEDLFRHIGMDLLTYIFPALLKDEDKLAEITDHYKKNPEALEGLMAEHLGVSKHEFVKKIMDQGNFHDLAKVNLTYFADRAGKTTSFMPVARLEREIYHPRFLDELKGKTAEVISYKSGGKIDLNVGKVLNSEELKPILRSSYSGELNESSARGHPLLKYNEEEAH